MLGTVMGTVLGTGDGVENMAETPCRLETHKDHSGEMIGCHEENTGRARGLPYRLLSICSGPATSGYCVYINLPFDPINDLTISVVTST